MMAAAVACVFVCVCGDVCCLVVHKTFHDHNETFKLQLDSTTDKCLANTKWRKSLFYRYSTKNIGVVIAQSILQCKL